MKSSKESASDVLKGSTKLPNIKQANLSRPLFHEVFDNEVINDELNNEQKNSSQDNCQMVAGPNNSYPRRMRFYMDFIYPTVESSPKNAATKSMPFSFDFTDNFDVVNLTQMLESTTAEVITFEEVPREKENEGASSEMSHVLSHPVDVKTASDTNSEPSPLELLDQARGLPNEPTFRLTIPYQDFEFETAFGHSPESSSMKAENRAENLLEACQCYFKESGSSSISETHSRQCLVNPTSDYRDGPPKSPSILTAGNLDPAMGFKTAAGNTLKAPSVESLKKAKRIFAEENDSTIRAALVREDILKKPISGCKTVLGAHLKTRSVDFLAQTKRLIEEGKDAVKEFGTTTVLNSVAFGTLRTPSCQAPHRVDHPLEDSSHQSTVHKENIHLPEFEAVTGTAPETTSVEPTERAGHIFEDCADPIFTHDPIGFTETSIDPEPGSVANSVAGSAPSRIPLTTGFTTGSGKKVTIASLASLKRSKLLIKECLKESTAAALNQIDEVPMEPSTSNNCAYSIVLSKVSHLSQGDSVSSSDKSFGLISGEAAKRAPTTFGECDDELESKNERSTINSPVEVSPSPITKGDCATSPVLDFDGSFEISSQMMNVMEGKTSQPQTSLESVFIENQRAVLRVQQESEAESRFKSLNIAGLSSSKNKSGSVSAGTSHFKAHKVLREPVARGLLWQYRRGCIRPVGQNPRTYSTPVSKDLCFVDDFLRLDEASSLSVTTASKLKFKIDSDGMSVVYILGDHVEIIPDRFGYAGCVEVTRAFVCSPGVTSGLASHQWITHHFRQLAWRFGSIALLHYDTLVRHVFPNISLPDSSVGRTDGRLLLHVLLLELRYRYDRELEAVQRPAIRKILERDDTPAKRLVLCVSHLECLPDKQYRGRLTDGWYHIDWVPDPMLTRLIECGQIRVGTKLATAGAELVQVPSGFSGGVESAAGEDFYLFGDSSIGLALRLKGNSTIPAPPNATLGFASHQPIAHLPPTPLFSISPDGGDVSSICVLIQRRFQLQYMETCVLENGDSNETRGSRRRHIFRDPRSERAAERMHTDMCQQAFDKTVAEIEASHNKYGRRIQPKASFLDSLGLDGEALWNAVSNALDPGLAESALSPAQRDAMLLYKETTMQEILSRSISKRKVTQLLRLHVAGIHPQDVKKRLELPLTLWNPTEGMLEVLREGSVVQLNRLHISTTRSTDPFAPPPSSTIDGGQIVSLSGGRGTTVRPLKLTEIVKFSKHGQPTVSTSVQSLVETVYRPRSFLSVGDLRSIAGNLSDRQKVVDFRALVVGIKIASTSNTSGKSDLTVVYLASLRNEDGVEDFSTLAILRVWGGLERYCLKSVLSARNRVHFTDVQFRSVFNLQVESNFPPDGSPEVSCVMLNYTTASYVTTEILPRGGSVNRRFRTQWKETPQFYSYMQTCMESHFEKFFSGKSFSYVSTSSSSRSSTRLLSPLTSTSKADSTSTHVLVDVMEQSGIKLEVPAKPVEPLVANTPSSKIRTRTGLCRPRKSVSAVLTMSTSNTSVALSESLFPDEDSLQNTCCRQEMKQSHPTPSAFSTPLPTKRSSSSVPKNLDDVEVSVTPLIAKRRRSTLFASSNPKQESSTSPRLETSDSSLFDFPTVYLDISSDTESTEPQRTGMDSSSVKALDSHAEMNSFIAVNDASLLDVSIADLVKTRKRKCSSQNSSPAPKKRPLSLKNTQ